VSTTPSPGRSGDAIRVVDAPQRGAAALAAKRLAQGFATLLVVPRLVALAFCRPLVGTEAAFAAASESIARVPGLRGLYMRQAFYRRTLAGCGHDVYFGWMTVFSKPAARLGDEVYLGRGCRLGWVDIGDGAMLSDGVQVLSGAHQHSASGAPGSMHRDGPQSYRRVVIGEGAWVGAGAVVMDDVGARAVVGAGAVVARAIPADRVAVGVPARVLAEPAGAETGA
jgi:acetyltransferase-like isoleucine patch superfamily enzyme